MTDTAEFRFSTRTDNAAYKALARSCGFSCLYSEQKTDPRNGKRYELEVYSKKTVSRRLITFKKAGPLWNPALSYFKPPVKSPGRSARLSMYQSAPL